MPEIPAPLVCRPLRIACLIPTHSIHAVRYLDWFTSRGHEMYVWDGAREIFIRWKGETPRPLPPTSWAPLLLRKYLRKVFPRLKPVDNRRQTGHILRRQLQAIRADVVHAKWLHGNGMLAALADFQPTFLTAWGSDIHEVHLLDPTERTLLRRALRRAAGVTAPSRDLLERCIALGARRGRAVRIAEPGISVDEFSRPAPPDLMRQAGVLPGERVVLSGRAMDPLYRIDQIVEAFALARPRLPGVKLVLWKYRAVPEYWEMLRQRISQADLAGAVHVVEEVPAPRLHEIYAHSDLLVSIPRWDGFPQTYYESMAAGCPILTSPLPTYGEVLRDGENVLFAAPEPAALAEGMVRLLTDEPRRQRLIAAGREAVRRLGDIDTEMAKTEALYRQSLPKDWARHPAPASLPPPMEPAPPTPDPVPVVVFAYRRPDHTRRLLDCLRRDGIPLLYAYVDGPRTDDDAAANREVAALFAAIDWCEVRLIHRDRNMGLGRSILAGVTEVLERHESAIVFEDDLVCVPGTYAFFCEALRRYANERKVFSITGWNHRRVTPPDADGPYFDGRAECWSWATWRRAWQGMNRTALDWMEECRARGIPVDQYGSDMPQMAREEAVKNIWAVRFLYRHLAADGLCLRPLRSLVEHEGWGDTATNASENADWAPDPPPPHAEIPRAWPKPRVDPHCAGLWRRVYSPPFHAPILTARLRKIRNFFGPTLRRLGLFIPYLSKPWSRITLFAIPKPFTGHIGVIQRNALGSWRKYLPDARIVLFGDEEGIEEAARAIDAEVVPHVARSQWGTPYLDAAFAEACRRAGDGLVAYLNADIVLPPHFPKTVQDIPFGDFLGVTRRIDLDVTTPIDWSDPARTAAFFERVRREGQPHPPAGSDIFVFPARSDLSRIPPFLVGRPTWDNYLLSRPAKLRLPLIDLSPRLLLIHQNHDYRHVPQRRGEFYDGPEGDYNLSLCPEEMRTTVLGHSSHLATLWGVFPAWTPDRLWKRLTHYPPVHWVNRKTQRAYRKSRNFLRAAGRQLVGLPKSPPPSTPAP